jgi:hypothetical protein
MKIKTISYGLTRNLGNYESARLDVQIELKDDDDYEQAFSALKAMVVNQIGGNFRDLESLTDKNKSAVRDKTSSKAATNALKDGYRFGSGDDIF